MGESSGVATPELLNLWIAECDGDSSTPALSSVISEVQPAISCSVTSGGAQAPNGRQPRHWELQPAYDQIAQHVGEGRIDSGGKMFSWDPYDCRAPFTSSQTPLLHRHVGMPPVWQAETQQIHSWETQIGAMRKYMHLSIDANPGTVGETPNAVCSIPFGRSEDSPGTTLPNFLNSHPQGLEDWQCLQGAASQKFQARIVPNEAWEKYVPQNHLAAMKVLENNVERPGIFSSEVLSAAQQASTSSLQGKDWFKTDTCRQPSAVLPRRPGQESSAVMTLRTDSPRHSDVNQDFIRTVVQDARVNTEVQKVRESLVLGQSFSWPHVDPPPGGSRILQNLIHVGSRPLGSPGDTSPAVYTPAPGPSILCQLAQQLQGPGRPAGLGDLPRSQKLPPALAPLPGVGGRCLQEAMPARQASTAGSHAPHPLLQDERTLIPQLQIQAASAAQPGAVDVPCGDLEPMTAQHPTTMDGQIEAFLERQVNLSQQVLAAVPSPAHFPRCPPPFSKADPSIPVDQGPIPPALCNLPASLRPSPGVLPDYYGMVPATRTLQPRSSELGEIFGKRSLDQLLFSGQSESENRLPGCTDCVPSPSENMLDDSTPWQALDSDCDLMDIARQGGHFPCTTPTTTAEEVTKDVNNGLGNPSSFDLDSGVESHMLLEEGAVLEGSARTYEQLDSSRDVKRIKRDAQGIPQHQAANPNRNGSGDFPLGGDEEELLLGVLGTAGQQAIRCRDRAPDRGPEPGQAPMEAAQANPSNHTTGEYEGTRLTKLPKVMDDLKCVGEVIATRQRASSIGRKHKHRGIVLTKNNKWEARMGQGLPKRKYLGQFESMDEAARAYDRAAIESCGPNATTNFDKADYPDELKAYLQNQAFQDLEQAEMEGRHKSESPCGAVPGGKGERVRDPASSEELAQRGGRKGKRRGPRGGKKGAATLPAASESGTNGKGLTAGAEDSDCDVSMATNATLPWGFLEVSLPPLPHVVDGSSVSFGNILSEGEGQAIESQPSDSEGNVFLSERLQQLMDRKGSVLESTRARKDVGPKEKAKPSAKGRAPKRGRGRTADAQRGAMVVKAADTSAAQKASPGKVQVAIPMKTLNVENKRPRAEKTLETGPPFQADENLETRRKHAVALALATRQATHDLSSGSSNGFLSSPSHALHSVSVSEFVIAVLQDVSARRLLKSATDASQMGSESKF